MRRHDNRDRLRCPHGGLDRWDKMGDDDIDAKPDELFSILLGTIASPIGVAELDPDVLAFRVAKGVQTAPESISERMRGEADTSTPMRGNFPGCCAGAASGRAAAAPPRSNMNS